MIRVLVAPRASSCSRTWPASDGRSPESSRTAPSSGPVISIAVRTASATSYVSTSRVVRLPRASTWEVNASFSVSCSRVNECADVPALGMP